MLRRGAPIALTVVLAACGAAPTAPAPLPQFQLSPGPHTLTVSVSPVIVTNPIGITSSTTVCAGSGPGSIQVPVDVAHEGNVWVARAQSGNLVLRLSETIGITHGTIMGRATQGGTTLTVNQYPFEPATVSAALSGAGVGGQIAGSVSYDTAQSSQSCSSNAWSLVPRR